MKVLAIITLIALLVAGCGQKGPLYLPDDADTATEQEG
ncbi:LPS translocon maturation chaperone LptM [Vreelandella olivaria]|nr:lipoprotein [Halomonas olivaria]